MSTVIESTSESCGLGGVAGSSARPPSTKDGRQARARRRALAQARRRTLADVAIQSRQGSLSGRKAHGALQTIEWCACEQNAHRSKGVVPEMASEYDHWTHE